MLHDAQYDKVKLLYKLSKLCWFLEKHAIENAQSSEGEDIADQLKELKDDLNRHIILLQKQL
ncbi:MAG: hypothetical protein WD055_05375 [Candidatus Dependentiae bacterium]